MTEQKRWDAFTSGKIIIARETLNWIEKYKWLKTLYRMGLTRQKKTPDIDMMNERTPRN